MVNFCKFAVPSSVLVLLITIGVAMGWFGLPSCKVGLCGWIRPGLVVHGLIGLSWLLCSLVSGLSVLCCSGWPGLGAVGYGIAIGSAC